MGQSNPDNQHKINKNKDHKFKKKMVKISLKRHKI